MVIFIRYHMKQVCNQCHKDYDVEEFNPCEIRSLMEEEHLCFKCAFWKWQLKLDKEVRPKENVIPLVSQEYYKTVVRPNKQSHYCLTLGPNNLIGRKWGTENISDIFDKRFITSGILTTEGHLYPYTGYSKDGGITHQGDIPVNNRDFATNAKFLHNEELYVLVNSRYVGLELLDDNIPGVFRVKVAKEIVDKQFNF